MFSDNPFFMLRTEEAVQEPSGRIAGYCLYCGKTIDPGDGFCSLTCRAVHEAQAQRNAIIDLSKQILTELRAIKNRLPTNLN